MSTSSIKNRKSVEYGIISQHDNNCILEDINKIQEYLECSKINFENRLRQQQMDESSVDDFIFHKTIGMGAFGRVMLVNHKLKPETFLAMKIMKKEQILKRNYLQHVFNEKQLLSNLRHPFIIQMEYCAKDICNLYFVMPFIVGGDLFGLMSERGVLDELHAMFYAGQMVLALEYLHSLDIIYRDLKPENVLIADDGFIKLTDLGLSKRITSNRTTTLCGTPYYLAPEIIAIKPYGKPVDWWALGIIMFEMVAGTVPFIADSEKKLFYRILSGSYRMPINFSPNLSHLVKNLLRVDLSKRYGNLLNGISDIKYHRWFSKIDWIMLYNKNMVPPYIPTFNSPSDTHNFESYVEEDTSLKCNGVDQIHFADF
ncbi:cAMP-dependent protein kinase catalytic subunit beta-like [Metopolophium dirhodum]|uniref:cAMP-dependent protein kinase catalytic subunit beta-like n=1 Tax=Metopolophium dirhodum TaxID=44670 RepID=UPI00298F908A|nr:cAMP-dependent protein kinase catalytic subunit beta-like [Metopolophium dirhodum]